MKNTQLIASFNKPAAAANHLEIFSAGQSGDGDNEVFPSEDPNLRRSTADFPDKLCTGASVEEPLNFKEPKKMSQYDIMVMKESAKKLRLETLKLQAR